MAEYDDTALRAQAFRQYAGALWLCWRLLCRGNPAEALRIFLTPVGYWRFLPNAFVALECPPGARVLDVGSPKMPSIYLTGKAQEVHACDLEDPKIFTRWGRIASIIGARNYHVSYQDARKLNFPDNSFDLVYSISVIEHIPDDGDTQALEEFRRVLKPGGVAVVEVPYRTKGSSIFAEYDSKGAPLAAPAFYERHYDREMLCNRLDIPGLSIRRKVILGEVLPVDPWISGRQLPKPLRFPILPLEPWLALINMRVRRDDTHIRPLAALLIYDKPLGCT